MSMATTSSIGAAPSATTRPVNMTVVKRGRTEQRAAAQERDDAILRQHMTILVGRLRDNKEPLVKHDREWAEVAVALQNANGLGHRRHQELTAAIGGRKPSGPEPLSCLASSQSPSSRSPPLISQTG